MINASFSENLPPAIGTSTCGCGDGALDFCGCGSGSWTGQRPSMGAYATGLVRQTAGHKKGVQAFKDKRPPKFTGR